MKKRKKTKTTNKKNKNKFNKDILGLIIIGFGIISMISLFTSKVGIVGNVISNTIFSSIGLGGYIFPVFLIVLGIIIILDKANKEDLKSYIIISTLFLIFLVLLDSKNISIDGFMNKMRANLTSSNLNMSGGLVGAFIGYFFYKLFGQTGGYIVLFFTVSVLLLLLFNIKLKDIFEQTKELIHNLKKNKKVKETSRKKVNIKNKKQKISENKKIIKDTKEIQILDYTEKNKNNKKLKEKTTSEENNDINKNIIYKKPSMDLLIAPKKQESNDEKEIRNNAEKIVETLNDFGIESKVTQINKGPTITCYELSPSPGIKVSRIVALSDDIALSLASLDIRIEAPIPGKSTVGIEVPNKTKNIVMLKEILSSDEYQNLDSSIPMALGQDVSGEAIVTSIDKMPHLLIAGATGSGKSVCINTIIMSILFRSSPDDVKLLLIDPKIVELSIYNKIPHLLIPVVTDPKKASFALNWAVQEMEKRYDTFAENNTRDIKSYNKKVFSQKDEDSDNDEEDEKNKNKLEKMPSIVIIIDELADLMMVAGQEVEEYISRIAQKARAAGIYLIVATQRPSVDVITGTIKANIPSRISFAVSSQIDSRTILDAGGAEKLLGKGDMLFHPTGNSKPFRIQGAFISDDEVMDIVDFLSKNYEQNYNEKVIQSMEKSKTIRAIDSDELLPDAIDLVLEENQASISYLQRKLRIGYARAARIVDEMEDQGIVGGHEGSKPRRILVTKDDLDNMDIL